MKQFIVLDHFLNKKDMVLTDVTPKVFDCIVPQKTTFEFKKSLKISDNDICIVRDGITKNVEYFGIIDTIEKDKTTRVATLPFISICDNELKVDTLDTYYGLIGGVFKKYTVQDYIADQITNNFVNTDDVYSKFNIVVRNLTTQEVYYNAVDDTDNLLDVLNEIFLNTGLYIDFNLDYEDGKVSKIYCDIHNANEETVKKIRFDNPQIVDKVDYKFSQYDNYSKCTIKVEDLGKSFEFYLMDNNMITTNPQSEFRIKKVKNKNIDFTADYESIDNLAEALVLLAQKTLCGNAFAYSIEFNILRRAISDWKFRQRCDFRAEDRLYQTYITNIEYINDEEARITLGAYRYTLTDKFKQLKRQPKEIGASLDGLTISEALGSTTYWFTQEDGNLYLNYPENETPPNFQIIDGDLVYDYNGVQPNFVVENGDLIYKFKEVRVG